MKKKKISHADEKASRKKIRKAVDEKLIITLGEYRPGIGGKRFDKTIRKMSKLFTSELLKQSKQKPRQESKPH